MAEHIVGMQPNMLKVPKVPSEFQVSSRKKKYISFEESSFHFVWNFQVAIFIKISS